MLIAHFQSINWNLGAATLNNHIGLTSDMSRAPSLWLQKLAQNSRTCWLQELPGVKHFKFLLASIFSITYWNWIRSFQFWKFCISVLLWRKISLDVWRSWPSTVTFIFLWTWEVIFILGPQLPFFKSEFGLGWGIHVNPWLIHVNVWQKPLQYCKVISLQLI